MALSILGSVCLGGGGWLISQFLVAASATPRNSCSHDRRAIVSLQARWEFLGQEVTRSSHNLNQAFYSVGQELYAVSRASEYAPFIFDKMQLVRTSEFDGSRDCENAAELTPRTTVATNINCFICLAAGRFRVA